MFKISATFVIGVVAITISLSFIKTFLLSLKARFSIFTELLPKFPHSKSKSSWLNSI